MQTITIPVEPEEVESPHLADTFADWLYGAVGYETAASLNWPTLPQVEQASTATVLTTALVAAANGRDSVAAHMLRELGRRFEARGV
jgi:hypothetical protein